MAVAERWGQYLEELFAHEVESGLATMPFFEYPYGTFGMMSPRSVTVLPYGADEPEDRCRYFMDEALLEATRSAEDKVTVARST